MGAIAAICTDKDLVGSFLFTLALNHKQVPFNCLFPKHYMFTFCSK